MIRRAVISGATGAIGTALVDELIKENIEVLVLCRKNSSRIESITKSPLVTVKQCSLEEMDSFQNDTGKEYDVFYHFAWMGTTGEGRNDVKLQLNNVKYAVDAVNLAKRFGCKVFIGAGSQAEYGRVEGVLKPDTPTFPETGYGIAKLCACQMTKLEAEKLSLGHIWVRVVSVYGPNDTPNSMVMSTVKSLKENIPPRFTKGEQLWDYLHSYDAARAFRLLAQKGKSGKIYVLSSGKAKALKEYINEIHAAVNPDCSIEMGVIPYSEKQVMYLQGDITELTKDTGFEPRIDFKDGILTILK